MRPIRRPCGRYICKLRPFAPCFAARADITSNSYAYFESSETLTEALQRAESAFPDASTLRDFLAAEVLRHRRDRS
jgi:hypothetical protein